MEQLEKLKEKEAELKKAYHKAVDEVAKIERQMKIPVAEKLYKGKYFIYENSRIDSEKRKIYIHCVGVSVTNPHYLIINSFETEETGELQTNLSMRINEMYPSQMVENEISEKEFYDAYNEFSSTVNEILK